MYKVDSDTLEVNEVHKVDSDSDSSSGRDKFTDNKRSSSFFSDEKGNLKFVNLVVRYPTAIFSFILVLSLCITVLLNVTVFKGGNPFTDSTNEFDLKDVRSVQYDSFRLAKDEVKDQLDEFIEKSAGTQVVPLQSDMLDLTYWIYEGENPDEGVFGNKKTISHMKDSHDLFLEDKDYQKYCLKDDGSCVKPISPLNMFYADSWADPTYLKDVDYIMEELSDPTKLELFNSLALCVNNEQYCSDDSVVDVVDKDWATDLNSKVKTVIDAWNGEGALADDIDKVSLFAAYLTEVPFHKGTVDFGFDRNFSIDNPKTMYSRAMILWGGPLNITTSAKDLTEEDKEEEDEKALKTYIVDNFLKEMNALAESKANENVNSFYFMGSLILEELLKIVQRDGLLALASFMFVFLWIRLNVGSWFLAFVGILEIYLSLPIAWFFYANIFRIEYFGFLNALAVFIVAAIGADDIFIFMDAYKQSKFKDPANLESLETRMSWVYRRSGNAMAITSATTCAAFLATMITPLASIKTFGIFTALVILVDYILVMTLFCTAVVIYHNKFEDRSCCGCCAAQGKNSSPTPTEKAYDELLENGGSTDRVSEFFKEKFAGFINIKLHRIVIFVVFVAWIIVATWQASLMEATKEEEQFLNKNHPLQKSIVILNNEFDVSEDDEGLDVYFVWGVGEVNREGVNLLFDDDNYGEPTFIDEFVFDEECQMAMLDVCEDLKTNEQYAPYIKREGGVGSVRCFVEEFGAFNSLDSGLDECSLVESGEWKKENWPVSPDNMAMTMGTFLIQDSCSDSKKNYELYRNEIGFNGEEVKYAAISFESAVLDPYSQKPESFVREQYDFIISLADKFDKSVGNKCGGNVVMTDLAGKFTFMNNQAIYVKTVLTSSLLGVGIAFVVLLLATRVLHIATFATLSILCILVSVAGTTRLIGWDLGSIESTVIGITAGFAVDYVVHLAHAYTTADGDTENRVIEAFSDLGISVFNGMVTSVGASIPLFLCQLQFFKKFGIFICLTIAFSWVFANFAFMSLIAQLKIRIKKGKFSL